MGGGELKRVESFSLKGIDRFVWFISLTIGSPSLMSVQSLVGSTH